MTSEIAKLRSLRATLEEMERPGFGAANDAAIADARSDIGAIEEAWPDERLIAAHRATTGEAGDAEADALRAEIERRGLPS